MGPVIVWPGGCSAIACPPDTARTSIKATGMNRFISRYSPFLGFNSKSVEITGTRARTFRADRYTQNYRPPNGRGNLRPAVQHRRESSQTDAQLCHDRASTGVSRNRKQETLATDRNE